MADAGSYADKVAKANMLLMLERRSDEQRSEIRDEILLSRAGFEIAEIAEIVGKNAPAVRMAISRAKKG